MTYFQVMAVSDRPTPLGLTVVSQTENSFSNRFDNTTPTGKDHVALLTAYLEQLRTNWTAVLNTPLRSFPREVQPLAETFQFYFSSRTKIEGSDFDSLLFPPSPLRLDATKFSAEEWHNLQVSDLKIRIAWFRQLSQLDPKTFLESKRMSMVAVSMVVQNLKEMEVRKLNGLLSASDVRTVLEAVDAFPVFTDDYIKKLAAIHAEQSNQTDIFAHGNRTNLYSGFAREFSQAIRGWYNSLWNENPSVFEPEMTAQWIWINNELDYFSDLLNAAQKLKGNNNSSVLNVEKFLDDSVRDIKNAGVLAATNATSMKVPKMSREDLALVRDFSQRFYFMGERFDLDYVSKCSKVIPSLKSGSWTEAVIAIQPNDVSENLTLPIQEFADYAKRSPNDQFRADLDQVRARLEGLQDLAKTMTREQP